MENKLSPLQQALLDSVLAEYAHVPEETQIDYTFSQRFEKWAKKLIAEIDHPAPKGRLSKTVKVLIIVAAIIALLAACAIAIPALREGLVDFFLTEKINHYGVTFDPAQAAYAPDEIEKYIVPSYIPEGFGLFLDDKSVAAVVVVWTNDQEELISYNQRIINKEIDDDDWIGISSESVARRSVVVNGYKVEIVEDAGVSTMIWTDNRYFYFLEMPNSLPFSEFEKMLSSMMIVGKGAYGITFDPEQAASAPDNIQTYFIPQYVPDGFSLIIDDKSVALVTVAWMNDKDELICYNQAFIPDDATDDSWVGISSEGVTRSTEIVSGYKVEIIQDEMVYTAIWTDNAYIYFIEMPNSQDLTVFEQILNSITAVS